MTLGKWHKLSSVKNRENVTCTSYCDENAPQVTPKGEVVASKIAIVAVFSDFKHSLVQSGSPQGASGPHFPGQHRLDEVSFNVQEQFSRFLVEFVRVR